jgi:hypothetical protein
MVWVGGVTTITALLNRVGLRSGEHGRCCILECEQEQAGRVDALIGVCYRIDRAEGDAVWRLIGEEMRPLLRQLERMI